MLTNGYVRLPRFDKDNVYRQNLLHTVACILFQD